MRNPMIQMRLRGTVTSNRPMNNSFGIVRNQNTQAHQGWDLEAPVGTPIYAIAQGKVHSTPNGGAYGRQVILAFSHRGKLHYAHYAHLSTVTVTAGQEVLEGTQLGTTGATGNAANLPVDERHLHFEIRLTPTPGLGLGNRVDPGSVLGFSVYANHEGGMSGY